MIILVGHSASGKTSIANDLIKRYGFKKFITYTTRKMRVGEVNDVDYHFVSKEEFIKMKDDNEFIETMEYNDNFYGSSYRDVGDNKVLIVDVRGANYFSELNNDNNVFFYVYCNEEETIKRMKLRGDKQEDIEKRLESDKELFNKSLMKKVDYEMDTSKSQIGAITDEVLRLYNSVINK